VLYDARPVVVPVAGSEGRIGRYRLIKRLAVGGMADIFLAQLHGPRGYERTVVVKTIRADLVDEEDLVTMLMEEARIASCLRHDNIVELIEVGEENGTHYLVMEFLFGRDLGQIRDRCQELGVRIPPEHVITLLADMLAALHHAHHEATFQGKKLSVIHRDVSPQNLIVGFDGSVKLLDFGLAKAAAQISRTRAGVLKGKYAYMSPEQVNFKGVDQRSDLFSAGVLLWEMLTQRRPLLSGQRLRNRQGGGRLPGAVPADRPAPDSRGDFRGWPTDRCAVPRASATPPPSRCGRRC
jgi:serine/threonine protein kinase